MGPLALTASIVNIVVGAGIFAVPSALAASVGPYAPLVFVVCAVAIGAVAICFAEGGSRVPTSGGAYGYIEKAYGPFAGYVAGTLLWFADALACGGIAAALADVAVTFLSPAPAVRVLVRVVTVVGVIGGIALVNLRGVEQGARLVNGATAVKLIPLAVFVVVGATAVHSANFTTTTAPSTEGLGRAAILALFAFSGMESSLCASGEVRDPARTIPRALGMAMLALTALYVAIQVIAQGILGGSLAQSTAPLADAMGRVGPGLRSVMVLGAAISMLGWLGSDILGTPRMLFALARDGWLPGALGRVHPGTHAPHVAILTYAALAIGLALSGSFAELAVLSELAVAPFYVAGCAAAWTLSRRRVALAGEPLGFRGIGLAAVVGSASMVLIVALASRAEILGLAVLLALCTATYFLRTRVFPRVARP
jgi:amino acid transporter